ncbi:carbohydrate ABC transporter permease [Fonticella tunisiensis]|uniref:Carbohydrate ABC transporter membrane protein 1 (CUT1 family) n=1 Tax=Fonticella tunisiensis TaxID=1096341 RepID=A0A4R7KCH3_9CLOT|nr:sugar ABC transporter permease [Fonticella tunisiensis]TDT51999.1 carbohydrate ABC transporter membrane protein 1 (CUT1 family) [Fonticella tunisiensis]
MKSKAARKLIPYFYTTPAMVVMFILVIYPIFFSIYISFTNMNMYHWKKYNLIGFDNYIRVLTSLDGEFYAVVLRTIIWTVINLVIQVSIAMGLALLLNIKELKFKGIMRTLLILPWAVPSYISALIWKGMFNHDFGIINILLSKLGLSKIPWLTSPVYGMAASIIANVWLAVPFMMIVCLGALQSIDHTYYEAADIDGATGFHKFFYITMPLIKPALVPAVILTSFVTFKQFDIIYLMTNGLGGKTDVVMTYAYNKAFTSSNYSLSSAFSVIIFFILLGLTILNMRLTKADKEV